MLKLALLPERVRVREPATDAPKPRTLHRSNHLYFAFLSYSHSDEGMADWLHGKLENFRVPASLAGRLTSNGIVPWRLMPIFRDRHELAAGGELSTDIKEALSNSRFLIVLCSPAAARSRWTNAEIDLFKKIRPDGCVIAAIVEGEPFVSSIPGREEEECLPPALRVRYDRRGRPTGRPAEPLAADLREHRDGRRFGLLKIIAGMLGVGLDDLVQRQTVRRQRRLAIVAAASLAGMVVTTGLALAAFDARDTARDQRREAEGLVGFMLGDLKDKLEQIGRLDVLDSVAARALAYYEGQHESSLSDDALAQRSRALIMMGQVASARGDLAAALRFFRTAHSGTTEALRRAPDNADRIYDHAQTVFYLGDIARARANPAAAEAALREYKRLAQRLIAVDPTSARSQMEMIHADSNLGILLNDAGRYTEAAAVFENALIERERLAASDPGNPEYKRAFAEGLGWLAEAREKEGRLEDGLTQRVRQIQFLAPLIVLPNSDASYRRQAMVGSRAAGRLEATLGNISGGIDRLRGSVSLGESLIKSEPSNTDWAALTSFAKLELATLLVERGAFQEAGLLTREACDAANRLLARDPSVAAWRIDLIGACLETGVRLALARKDQGAATRTADQYLAAATREASSSPTVEARLALANAALVRGLVAAAADDQTSLAQFHRRALSVWPGEAPQRPVLLARRAIILAGVGRHAEASALANRLSSIGYRNPGYLRDKAMVQTS
jgi:eukaryotic-like serine/threonine-protein kinase